MEWTRAQRARHVDAARKAWATTRFGLVWPRERAHAGVDERRERISLIYFHFFSLFPFVFLYLFFLFDLDPSVAHKLSKCTSNKFIKQKYMLQHFDLVRQREVWLDRG